MVMHFVSFVTYFDIVLSHCCDHFPLISYFAAFKSCHVVKFRSLILLLSDIPNVVIFYSVLGKYVQEFF